jgi:hypothetical protein
MGFDTECDLAVEAPVEAPRGAALRERIVSLRNDLLAEHLGVTPAAVSAALAHTGSLIGTIEALRRPEGRTLRPAEVEPPGEAEHLLADIRLLDPEWPGQAERRLTHLIKRVALAPRRALVDAIRWTLDRSVRRLPLARGR